LHGFVRSAAICSTPPSLCITAASLSGRETASSSSFRSVVDAVRCAIEVQNGMLERNAGLPPERRIEFRIGIHLGDVVEESDGDLMGDGVNIASRLEGCLSEDAYRQVRDRIKKGFIRGGAYTGSSRVRQIV
jgi:class 3 adenylate cyclase